MRHTLKLVAVLAMLVGLSLPAYATPITLDPAITPSCGTPECLMATGNEVENPAVLSAIDTQFPGLTSNSVYKQNTDDTFDTGPAAAWYETVFLNPPDDPSGALVTWTGPGYILGPTYLLVKDGKQIPAWYLFDVSNWGGMDTITLQNFWPGTGAISHIEIFGSTAVPDGGSMAILLGMALIGLAGVRRMMR